MKNMDGMVSIALDASCLPTLIQEMLKFASEVSEVGQSILDAVEENDLESVKMAAGLLATSSVGRLAAGIAKAGLSDENMTDKDKVAVVKEAITAGKGVIIHNPASKETMH